MRASPVRLLACLFAALAIVVGSALPAAALSAIEIGREQDRIDITAFATTTSNVGDKLQIQTVQGSDGVTERMSVPSVSPGSNPTWVTFAFRNVTDKRVEHLLTADRYTAVGSHILGPRLDARQIAAVTPSLGFLPEQLALDDIDAFRLTVEPGQTVTFVVELAPRATPRLYAWRPSDFDKHARNRQLLNGVLLGITGLLAVFLSAVFAANHKVIFPAAALFTWAVLAYFLVDFGFWHKLFAVRPEDSAQYRAATEAGVAATFVIFASVFLRIGQVHAFVRALLRLWIVALLALIGVAFLDPRLAATFARLTLGANYALLSLFVAFFAVRGQDRALALLPVWMLFGVWLVGMGLLQTGRLQTEAAVTASTSALALIVLLIGFTATQFAFRTVDHTHVLSAGDQSLRLLALENSGAATWEWTARRDEISVGPGLEAALGLEAGDLHAPASVFLGRMHPVDRDRLRQLLDSLREAGKGELRLEFRMRHVDDLHRWFVLDAAFDPTSERRRARVVGLIRETTDSHFARDRYAFDAVHDGVTGLPNRALFLDRVGTAIDRAQREPLVQPAVFVVAVERGATTTAAIDTDGLLISLSRRLRHTIPPGETLARVDHNQFGVLLTSQRSAQEIRAIADSIRLTVRSLVKIADAEISPTAAIGYAVHDRNAATSAGALLDRAEIAMHRAVSAGRDAIVGFTADMQSDDASRTQLQAELTAAIEKRQITLAYQPILAMRSRQLVGFVAEPRWEHPRLGRVDPVQIAASTESDDLIVRLAKSVIAVAVDDLKRFQGALQRPDAPLTMSIDASRRQLLTGSLADHLREVVNSAGLPRGCLRLDFDETLVMENPEHAAKVLGEFAAAGVGLSLTDFGTGYSSLTYLSLLPFDTIKLDKALVHGSGDAGAVSSILRSAITLAHELGKKVVAVGIDTESDASALRALGCEYALGDHYDRAKTAKDTVQALREQRKSDRKARGGLFKTGERRVRAGKAPPPLPDVAPDDGAVAAAGVARRQPARPQRSAPPPVKPETPPPRPAAVSDTAAMPRRRTVRIGPPGADPLPAARLVRRPVPGPRPDVRDAPPPDQAGRSVNASLAALGAELDRPTVPPPPAFPPPRKPPAEQAVPSPPARDRTPVPEPLLNALASSLEAASAAPPQAPPAPAASASAEQPPAPALDLSVLPADIAASLAKLAGQRAPGPSAGPSPPFRAAGAERRSTATPKAE